MSLFSRFFREKDERAALRPLYDAVVAEAREPVWYASGGVPDTLDGRFDMIALVLSLVLVRIEQDGEAGRAPGALLAELFIDDMDAQLREIGVGDVVVGKHVGRMMSALGGRLTAYRAASDRPALADALARNLWRGDPPGAAETAVTLDRAEALRAGLPAIPLAELLAGRLPKP